jgi:hypothetical protein
MILSAPIVVSVIAWSATYVLLRRRMRKEIGKPRTEPHQERTNAAESLCAVGNPPRGRFHSDELDPKTLSALGASVSALLGRDVTVSPVHDGPVESRGKYLWAQEGYVEVQHSHDLRILKRATVSKGYMKRVVVADGIKKDVA